MNRYGFIASEKAVRVELAFGVYQGDIFTKKHMDAMHRSFHKIDGYPQSIKITTYDTVRNVFIFIRDGFESHIDPMKLEACYENTKSYVEGSQEIPRIKSKTIQGMPHWPKASEDDWLT